MADPSTFTNGSADEYSVPKESMKAFRNSILNNPLFAANLPGDFETYAGKIKFEGSNSPSIPVNWKFAESISALMGLEGVFVQALLAKKYQTSVQEILINTDHASLFIMSALLFTIDPEGKNPLPAVFMDGGPAKKRFDQIFKDCDIHGFSSTLHRNLTSNIYKTKDGRYFHIHGSLDTRPTLRSIGLPEQSHATTFNEALQPFVKALSEIDSEDMQRRAAHEYKQAGTICYTADEYLDSEHGKANAHVGLYEIIPKSNLGQKPCWWPSSPATSASRPLAGLKVVDLTRIIAAPAITRGLAELGASVMRITAPHLPDLSQLHPDLNWGKWNASLDLREASDRAKLKTLIMDADVVVSGYRPGVFEKYGFGTGQILEMCKDRERGIIAVRENCYGWYGPWTDRSGWQQISDANCGVSMGFGRAMGNDEPVTPIFPNADYCAGVIGVCAVLDAILRRSEHGGSFQVDIALNYYSQFLITVGTYPAPTWSRLRALHSSPTFRHYHTMAQTISTILPSLHKNCAEILFRPEFFEIRDAKAVGVRIRTVSPVLRFVQEEVKLGFQVGTRGNGVDRPEWPEDLGIEVVV